MSTIESVKLLLVDMGTAWVLWMLAGLSAASVAVFVERRLAYRAADIDLEALARRLHEHLRAGRRPEAVAELEGSRAVAARIAAAGLRLADLGPASADQAMQSAVALERRRLERWLAFLGTLGNNAPFIGLFGTVIGVVTAFDELGHGAPGHEGADAAAQVASQAVMGAIAEALVATAVGLLVALPAVAMFNLLQRRVTALLDGAEVVSRLVLAYLSDAREVNDGE